MSFLHQETQGWLGSISKENLAILSGLGPETLSLYGPKTSTLTGKHEEGQAAQTTENPAQKVKQPRELFVPVDLRHHTLPRVTYLLGAPEEWIPPQAPGQESFLIAISLRFSFSTKRNLVAQPGGTHLIPQAARKGTKGSLISNR